MNKLKPINKSYSLFLDYNSLIFLHLQKLNLELMKKYFGLIAILVFLVACQEQQKIGFIDNGKVINAYQEKIDIEEKYKLKDEDLSNPFAAEFEFVVTEFWHRCTSTWVSRKNHKQTQREARSSEEFKLFD